MATGDIALSAGTTVLPYGVGGAKRERARTRVCVYMYVCMCVHVCVCVCVLRVTKIKMSAGGKE